MFKQDPVIYDDFKEKLRGRLRFSISRGGTPPKWSSHPTRCSSICRSGSAGSIRFEDEGLVVTPDQAITDGPFPESKEMIGGYVMISADSIEEAAEIGKGCPILLSGGKVEVRPVALIKGHNDGG